MADDRRRPPTGVGSVLDAVLARLDPDNRIALWRRWDAVVGEPIASHARPNRLEDGVLVVEVTSHAWAQELQHLRGDLATRLNRAFGAKKVREIRFVVGGERAAGARPKRPSGG